MRRPVLLGLAVLMSVAACGDDSEVKRDAAGGEGGSNFDGGAGTGGGGGGVGGSGGSAGDGGVACPVSSFVTPTAGQVLTPSGGGTGTADAAVGDGGAGDGGAVVSACPGGNLVYDVKLATSAANGQMVALFAGSAQIATATANGAVVEFKNVMLGQGAQMLRAQVVGVPATCAAAMVSVTVDCMLPTCSITKPVISASHPKLNNVAAPNGDRVSSPGSDYQVAFEVTTNIEDGQPVRLEVAAAGNASAITTVNGVAMGGKAAFAGVTLRPDGDFQVQAICTNRVGLVSRSTKGTYPVDTEAPQLTVTTPTDGKHYNPGDLTAAGKFGVCVTTTSTDAVNVPVSATSMGKNLCAGVGTASGECAGVTSGSGMNCVELTCPGGAPFDVNVTLTDAAGNPSTKKITGVTCASTLPSVQIVAPLGDTAPFSDVSKRLLAASGTNALKDIDPNRAGAQANVVACTDVAGGKARLYVGTVGAALTQVGAEVTVAAAQSSDNCPSALGYVAKWPSATLPESASNADGTLSAATEIRVAVTDVSTAVGTSGPTRLWVDSIVPTISVSQPNPLCGRQEQSATPVNLTVRLNSVAAEVKLVVTGSSGAVEYLPVSRTGITTDFGMVSFPLGENQVASTSVEPSGNAGVLSGPCVVKVGVAPVVSWAVPAALSNLCGATASGACELDGDAGTAGWQGKLRVNVAVGGSPATSGMVTFSEGTNVLGTAAIVNGVAELTGVSIADAQAVTLKAETDDIGGTGTGTASRTLIVDTEAPPAPSNLVPSVKSRRQTTFHLDWTAPAGAAGYQVRSSTAAINGGNFDAAASTTYTGTAAAGGQPDGVDVPNLLIEKEYYFAVRATDAVGNRSDLVSAGPLAARFNVTVFGRPGTGPANERFGNAIDGAGDLDGDGRADLLIGSVTSQNAYIYFGAADAADLADGTKRRVTVISGPANAAFGRSFVVAGDIDGDGRDDIAVSASRAGNGRVYIFKGRAVWANSYNADTDADYTIELDATYANTRFGESLARLGKFTGLNADGMGNEYADALAIGASGYGTNRGRVVVVLGKKNFTDTSLETVIIDGAPDQATGLFGDVLLGLGRFYTDAPGTTLAVAATGASTNAGIVYAFHGLPPGSYTTANARQTKPAPGGGGLYGSRLGLIGSIGGALGVGVRGSGIFSTDGFVELSFGSVASGPFTTEGGSTLRMSCANATAAGDGCGRLVFGGGYSGTSVNSSLVGDATVPDVVIVTSREGANPGAIYIMDGSTVRALPNPSDVVSVAEVRLALPADWNQVALYQRTGLVRDVDGDGVADIAVGEYSTGAIEGRVALYW